MNEEKKKLLTEDMPETDDDLSVRRLRLNEDGALDRNQDDDDQLNEQEPLSEDNTNGPRLLCEDL